MTAPEYVTDQHYCQHCQKCTPHLCRYSDHERDASSDYFVCQVCNWYYSGLNGKYNPPEKE